MNLTHQEYNRILKIETNKGQFDHLSFEDRPSIGSSIQHKILYFEPLPTYEVVNGRKNLLADNNVTPELFDLFIEDMIEFIYTLLSKGGFILCEDKEKEHKMNEFYKSLKSPFTKEWYLKNVKK